MNPIMIVFAMMMPMVFAAADHDAAASGHFFPLETVQHCVASCNDLVDKVLDCAWGVTTEQTYNDLQANAATWLSTCPFTGVEGDMMECFWDKVTVQYPCLVECRADWDVATNCLVTCFHENLPAADIC